MKLASLSDNLQYNDNRPTVEILMETGNSKEIRMTFKKDQVLKAHQTPFPIVVEIFEGAINFSVNDQVVAMKKGDLIALEGNIIHALEATQKSTVRLSLTGNDSGKRIAQVANNSK